MPPLINKRFAYKKPTSPKLSYSYRNINSISPNKKPINKDQTNNSIQQSVQSLESSQSCYPSVRDNNVDTINDSYSRQFDSYYCDSTNRNHTNETPISKKKQRINKLKQSIDSLQKIINKSQQILNNEAQQCKLVYVKEDDVIYNNSVYYQNYDSMLMQNTSHRERRSAAAIKSIKLKKRKPRSDSLEIDFKIHRNNESIRVGVRQSEYPNNKEDQHRQHKREKLLQENHQRRGIIKTMGNHNYHNSRFNSKLNHEDNLILNDISTSLTPKSNNEDDFNLYKNQIEQNSLPSTLTSPITRQTAASTHKRNKTTMAIPDHNTTSISITPSAKMHTNRQQSRNQAQKQLNKLNSNSLERLLNQSFDSSSSVQAADRYHPQQKLYTPSNSYYHKQQQRQPKHNHDDAYQERCIGQRQVQVKKWFQPTNKNEFKLLNKIKQKNGHKSKYQQLQQQQQQRQRQEEQRQEQLNHRQQPTRDASMMRYNNNNQLKQHNLAKKITHLSHKNVVSENDESCYSQDDYVIVDDDEKQEQEQQHYYIHQNPHKYQHHQKQPYYIPKPNNRLKNLHIKTSYSGSSDCNSYQHQQCEEDYQQHSLPTFETQRHGHRRYRTTDNHDDLHNYNNENILINQDQEEEFQSSSSKRQLLKSNHRFEDAPAPTSQQSFAYSVSSIVISNTKQSYDNLYNTTKVNDHNVDGNNNSLTFAKKHGDRYEIADKKYSTTNKQKQRKLLLRSKQSKRQQSKSRSRSKSKKNNRKYQKIAEAEQLQKLRKSRKLQSQPHQKFNLAQSDSRAMAFSKYEQNKKTKKARFKDSINWQQFKNKFDQSNNKNWHPKDFNQFQKTVNEGRRHHHKVKRNITFNDYDDHHNKSITKHSSSSKYDKQNMIKLSPDEQFGPVQQDYSFYRTSNANEKKRRFIQQVWKHPFAERYLSQNDVLFIFARLEKSKVPQHRWMMFVVDEVHKKMKSAKTKQSSSLSTFKKVKKKFK